MTATQAFFAGKSVLVTGVTGFLGKVLVEKILRGLPGIGRVYLLIRPTQRADRVVGGAERLRGEVLTSSIFDRLKEEWGEAFPDFVESRLTVVEGDLAHGRLGVSEEDYRRLAAEVEVILNSAAIVGFDGPLDQSLDLNTLGIRRLLDFARDCQRLRALVQISTCYVSGRREGWIREEIDEPPFDVEAEAARLEARCAHIRRRHADGKARDLLVALGLRRARELGWHDTYTFTKWMGEQFLVKYRGEVPTAIVRPAIIESTYREPCPGWIDGFRMSDPLFVGFGKGQLEDFPAGRDTILDLIPADQVVNGILACAPRCAEEGGLRVYQMATGDQNPASFPEIYELSKEYFTRHPLRRRDGAPIRVSTFTFPDPAAYRRRLLWRKGLPSRASTAVLRPLSFVRRADKLRRKLVAKAASLDLLFYYIDIYSPYTTIKARFATANTQGLWNSLSPGDKELFPFDASSIDWHEYITAIHLPGLKRHVLKLADDRPGREHGPQAPPAAPAIDEIGDGSPAEEREAGRVSVPSTP